MILSHIGLFSQLCVAYKLTGGTLYPTDQIINEGGCDPVLILWIYLPMPSD